MIPFTFPPFHYLDFASTNFLPKLLLLKSYANVQVDSKCNCNLVANLAHKLCRAKGILFVAIDQSKPLSDQGPFDIVLHKATIPPFLIPQCISPSCWNVYALCFNSIHYQISFPKHLSFLGVYACIANRYSFSPENFVLEYVTVCLF